ncbi:MAG: AbrB/MazE/SpoVT family DNA-binding domain-containing protein [Candidatus Bathyarchaeota archaeon]|nr:AbrB/MazE/SpoVT family DNA-binding domain-containing protein [Candidatus Bathyarchaeum sp.]
MPVKFESSVMQVGNSFRITIPQEISKHLEINKGDILEVWVDNHTILLEKKKLIFDAIWAFKEDILQLRKDLKANITAHVSQPLGKPLHKYKGKISITRNNLILEGELVDSKQQSIFLFSQKEITDFHLGWDNTLRRWKDSRAYIKPLRIMFRNGIDTKVVYIYTKNPNSSVYGEKNQEIYEILEEQKIGTTKTNV